MGFWSGVWSGLKDIWGFMTTPITEIGIPLDNADIPAANEFQQDNGIARWLTDDVGEGINDIKDGIENAIGGAGDSIADFFQGIFDWFGGIGDWIQANWWLIAIIVVLFAILYFGRGGGLGVGGGGGGTDDRDISIRINNYTDSVKKRIPKRSRQNK